MRPNTKSLALEYALWNAPREACGLVLVRKGKEEFFPCRNIAEDAQNFILHPDDYASAEDRGDIVAVFHSHVEQSPKPSQADRVACEASGLPWYIVSVPGGEWDYLEPCGYKAPLIGREYSLGVLDCYTIIRDFYRQEFKIELPDFDRRGKFWERGEQLYLEKYREAGFEKVFEANPRRGDIFLLQLFNNVVSHAAIYLGDGVILHHLEGRLSTREVYNGHYQKHTVATLRHGKLARC